MGLSLISIGVGYSISKFHVLSALYAVLIDLETVKHKVRPLRFLPSVCHPFVTRDIWLIGCLFVCVLQMTLISALLLLALIFALLVLWPLNALASDERDDYLRSLPIPVPPPPRPPAPIPASGTATADTTQRYSSPSNWHQQWVLTHSNQSNTSAALSLSGVNESTEYESSVMTADSSSPHAAYAYSSTAAAVAASATAQALTSTTYNNRNNNHSNTTGTTQSRRFQNRSSFSTDR